MIIAVTEKHILKGVHCDKSGCPIALAMHDAGLRGVLVGGDYMMFKTGFFSKKKVAGAPDSVTRFVDHYDSGEEVFPFEFEIN